MIWMLIFIWINSGFTHETIDLDGESSKVGKEILTQLAKAKWEPKEPFSSDGGQGKPAYICKDLSFTNKLQSHLLTVFGTFQQKHCNESEEWTVAESSFPLNLEENPQTIYKYILSNYDKTFSTCKKKEKSFTVSLKEEGEQVVKTYSLVVGYRNKDIFKGTVDLKSSDKDTVLSHLFDVFDEASTKFSKKASSCIYPGQEFQLKSSKKESTSFTLKGFSQQKIVPLPVVKISLSPKKSLPSSDLIDLYKNLRSAYALDFGKPDLKINDDSLEISMTVDQALCQKHYDLTVCFKDDLS